MSPIVEVPMEHLSHQCRGAQHLDPCQLYQPRDFWLLRDQRNLCGDGGVTVSLELFRVLHHEVEALEAARDLGTQLETKRSAVANSKLTMCLGPAPALQAL
ncbi:hypothetical protein [Roseomonas sp. KE2513]|uniref:hypothetical protein n=1 Tax=Roseomonas sp. KE2513 TaxID=2479202 RepID=UPI0018DEF0AA|nr:hypothetical protein [Roseomonas sp. KE2513]